MSAHTLDSPRPVDFAIRYGGSALNDHQMDVRDFAPAVLSLAKVFQEANELVSPGLPPVSLNIRATGDGSFLAELILTAYEVTSRGVDLLNADMTNALINLKDLIIMPAGLFMLIKRAGRATPQRQEPSDRPGYVRLTFPDGTVFECPPEVLRLFDVPSIRENARRVIRPLESEGIDRVDFLPTRTAPPAVTIYEADVPMFEPPEPVEPEPVHTTESELLLEITHVSFTEGNMWGFTDGTSGQFRAKIEHKEFWQRVERGEEAFRKTDLLRARVAMRSFHKEGGGIRTEYTIVEVLEHVEPKPTAPADPNLPFPPPD